MKRYKHSLSHYRLLTADMGNLVPIACTEVLPGDTFQQSTSALIRVSPLVAPVMHPVSVRIHHFFVPNRLLWDSWEDFITGNLVNPTYPTITVPATPDTTAPLLNYLGVPPTPGLEISAFPIRAFNKIYNEFYRDQDLVTERTEDDTTLPQCAWEKDYFTSARPWAQKGPSVTIPLGGDAPVIGLATDQEPYVGSTALTRTDQDLAQTKSEYRGVFARTVQEGSGSTPSEFPRVVTDLSQADAVDVNEFRRAFALQRYQEARARYGSRYTEYLRYLGINPSDARLQRPEYLGGGRQTIAFSEVLRTGNESGATTAPIGEMAGHGIAAVKSNRYRKFFEEHGHVITLMSVRPKSMYTNNLHRKWSRRTKEDYFQKELEAIGQQEVYNREVYADASQDDDTVFGYADRYREYREEPSQVSGEFRSLLNYWHMAREFGSRPALNADFVNCVPTKRIHAEQTKHALWCMVNHSIQSRRMVNNNANARIL